MTMFDAEEWAKRTVIGKLTIKREENIDGPDDVRDLPAKYITSYHAELIRQQNKKSDK